MDPSLGAHALRTGSLLAYSVDHQGKEIFTLRVRDLARGEDLPDELSGTMYGLALGLTWQTPRSRWSVPFASSFSSRSTSSAASGLPTAVRTCTRYWSPAQRRIR
jgi:hypothetical protein